MAARDIRSKLTTRIGVAEATGMFRAAIDTQHVIAINAGSIIEFSVEGGTARYTINGDATLTSGQLLAVNTMKSYEFGAGLQLKVIGTVPGCFVNYQFLRLQSYNIVLPDLRNTDN